MAERQRLAALKAANPSLVQDDDKDQRMPERTFKLLSSIGELLKKAKDGDGPVEVKTQEVQQSGKKPDSNVSVSKVNAE